MAAGLAASQANAILDALLRSVAYSDPAEVWLQLHTGDPGASGASNAATETTRKQATFDAAAAGASTNSGAITWSNVAATETYSYYSAFSASSGGTFLFSDAFNSARAVTAGDSFQINAGELDVNITVIAA